MNFELIRQADPQVADAIELELERQRAHIELIARRISCLRPCWKPWAHP